MAFRATERELRVMIVASGDLWAGAEAHVLTLARSLRERDDVAVCVVVFNDGELALRLRGAGITTHCLDETRLRSTAMLRGMFDLVRRVNPHVVHTHRPKENVLGGVVARLLGSGSVRTVHGIEEHAIDARDWRRRLLKAIDHGVARHCQQAIVAVSDDLATRLRAEYPRARFPRTEVVTILNGIDERAVRDAARAVAPASIALPDAEASAISDGAAQPLHIGTMGRLVPIKRLDRFIDLAAHLAHRYPGRHRFHVVGDGPDAEALAARADVTTPPGTVVFHGFQNNPLPLLARLNALVFTSDYEGLPMTALESLALGVPVVSRDVGGLRVLHDRGADVRLAATDDVDGLAEVILALDPSAPPSRLPDEFTAAHSADRYVELFGRCARGRSTGVTGHGSATHASHEPAPGAGAPASRGTRASERAP